MKGQTTLIATFKTLEQIEVVITYQTEIKQTVFLTIVKTGSYQGFFLIGEYKFLIQLNKNIFSEGPEVVGNIVSPDGVIFKIEMYYFKESNQYKGFVIFPTTREAAAKL